MKQVLLPKKIIRSLFLSLFMLIFSQLSWGQTVLTEDFNYTTATTLVANGWTASSGTGTNNLTVNGTGLTYTGSPASGVGLSVSMTTTGEDAVKTFTAITSGSVYQSFLMKVSAAQTAGDYFIGLITGTTASPAFALRIYAKTSG